MNYTKGKKDYKKYPLYGEKLLPATTYDVMNIGTLQPTGYCPYSVVQFKCGLVKPPAKVCHTCLLERKGVK